MKTVCVDFWAGQVRGAGVNRGTQIARTRLVPAALDVRSLFIQAYETFAPVCRSVDEPGVALIAIDETTGRAAGMACLRARANRSVCAIVGRHDRCDLYLPGNDELALRQLAVIVAPVRGWSRGASEVSFRVLDLRSTHGMLDEQGRQLRGLRSEGPTFVRCGGYLVCALPLGDATDWPASPADAWACLPERVYFDERLAMAGSVVAPPPVRDPQVTSIVRLNGPSELGSIAGRDDTIAGRLSITGRGMTATIDITYQALSDGVLIGRYARCANAGLVNDESLSRVHLLLVQADDCLLAIDTASTNGTRFPGAADARLFELGENTELEVGNETRVRWRWVS